MRISKLFGFTLVYVGVMASSFARAADGQEIQRCKNQMTRSPYCATKANAEFACPKIGSPELMMVAKKCFVDMGKMIGDQEMVSEMCLG